MAGDPYIDKGSGVLKNTLGITDGKKLAQLEFEFSWQRARELVDSPIKGEFDENHFKAIHRHLFQDVYAWAGEIRTIGIQKHEPLLGDTIHYPHPEGPTPDSNLRARLDYAFSQLGKDGLAQGAIPERNRFVQRLAKHIGEIWECHPFREGNTRTTTAFVRQLVTEVGYSVETTFPENPDEFRNALTISTTGDYSRLERQLARGLTPTADRAEDAVSNRPGHHDATMSVAAQAVHRISDPVKRAEARKLLSTMRQRARDSRYEHKRGSDLDYDSDR